MKQKNDTPRTHRKGVSSLLMDNFAEALAKVADMGYTVVQMSGCCKYELQWFKEELGLFTFFGISIITYFEE